MKINIFTSKCLIVLNLMAKSNDSFSHGLCWDSYAVLLFKICIDGLYENIICKLFFWKAKTHQIRVHKI